MRRILRLAALPILALFALVLGAAGPAAAASAGHSSASSAASCTGPIQIDSFAFGAPVVTAGQTAVAALTATNCTAQPVNAMVEAYGQFFGPSGNSYPPGCPVVDPIAMYVTFAANGHYTNNFGTLTFSGCAATSYREYVRFTIGGTIVASATATVAIQGGATASCHVAYTKQSEWQGGFVAAISITNTGTVPIYSWQLAFTFGGDQQITQIWNAQYTQTGEAVKISAAASSGSNGLIAPGATVSGIGFLGTWHTSDAPPASFAVNGLACA